MKIGIIGCGNMGEAILAGVLNAGIYFSEDVYVYEKNEDRKRYIVEKYDIKKEVEKIKDIVEMSDFIILAVKPNIYPIILSEIKKELSVENCKDKVIVSIAAGVTISQIEEVIGSDKKVIRTMPNTPALVGMGMSSISINKNITQNELLIAKNIFESFGKVEEMDEKLIDSVIAVSGSAPAYVYMFIEAMADGAVLGGMARDKAYKFAAQTVMGAAKMIIETGEHPGKLKDNVCSPGGTTIEAVTELERKGFRGSIIDAMVKCMDKSKKMSGNK